MAGRGHRRQRRHVTINLRSSRSPRTRLPATWAAVSRTRRPAPSCCQRAHLRCRGLRAGDRRRTRHGRDLADQRRATGTPRPAPRSRWSPGATATEDDVASESTTFVSGNHHHRQRQRVELTRPEAWHVKRSSRPRVVGEHVYGQLGVQMATPISWWKAPGASGSTRIWTSPSSCTRRFVADPERDDRTGDRLGGRRRAANPMNHESPPLARRAPPCCRWPWWEAPSRQRWRG